MEWIDAHAHLPLVEDEVEGTLGGWGVVGVVNICVDHADLGGLGAQRGWYRKLAERWPGRVGWVTSFSLEGFGSTGWAEGAVEGIRGDVGAGACGVKVWKNVGMELRDSETGELVLADDGRFAPVYRGVAGTGRPLLMHIAEPIQAWRELDPRDPHYGYFSQAKKWHWYGRTDVPSHERLIESRDAVVRGNPDLVVVGLHLGSQEHDLGAVGERLAKWGNYWVDTGARLGDLAVHAERDWAGLRGFLTRWSERVMWGEDWVLTKPEGEMSTEARKKFRVSLRARYELEKRFLSTQDVMEIAGRRVRGLGLEGDVLDRLVCGNARRLYFRG